jgi:trehalose 6-phosphate phosphatase
MHYALSSRSRHVLREFAASNVVFAFDFDGTLAPIVTSPERACMRRTTRLLLSKLASVRTCLALSGRALGDLKNKLAGTGVAHHIGNHGAEPWDGADRLRKEVSRWRQALATQLPDLPGLWIENKTFSLTIHFRRCRRKAEARLAIENAARSLAGVRLVEGKQAVSIVSQRAPNKGAALKAELTRLNCGGALYVGDADTDEDVFALGGEGLSLLTVRVGRKKRSRAGYFLRSQKEIDSLLRLLLHASSSPQVRRRARRK